MTSEEMKDKLAVISNLLTELAGAAAEIVAGLGAAEQPAEAKPEQKAPSLEDVRAVLADISRSGKTAEMKSLLGRFGAAKLSDVDPKDYSALLEAAGEVANA